MLTMTPLLRLLIAALSLLGGFVLHAIAATPTAEAAGPIWNMKHLAKAPRTFPAYGFQTNHIQGSFFESVPFRGRPTRVFAWLGIPPVEKGRKVPGMVLVHGGGGTAFAEWVRLWNERGYAAIAMDTCGCVPVGKYANWQRHEHGGPAGWGGFNQIDEPREDQWSYHAVAAAILAHSLLRAQPEVEAKRVGLTGISWGGYLTCLIAGVDRRFKFAVPVYGCGFYLDTVFASNLGKLSPEQRGRWLGWWEPSEYLDDASMPFLWVTGSNDFAYPIEALQKSYRVPRGARTLAIRLRMPHGHGGAGEKPEEIHVFADSLVKGGEPLARITRQGRKGTNVWATFKSPRPVVKAELNITRDLGRWQDRKWEALPAHVNAGKVTATLPAGVTVYYLNLFDDRDCAVSTEHEEMKP
ncbi:MAG: acetylxylan esterase [Verrucomicrobia bacterium]|nr:acetylxylan esterase [Verrucomicrobiota bacterium]